MQIKNYVAAFKSWKNHREKLKDDTIRHATPQFLWWDLSSLRTQSPQAAQLL